MIYRRLKGQAPTIEVFDSEPAEGSGRENRPGTGTLIRASEIRTGGFLDLEALRTEGNRVKRSANPADEAKVLRREGAR